jgi:DNA-binding winged helix-turn-helix (wHTH) protein/TolB-like protein
LGSKFISTSTSKDSCYSFGPFTLDPAEGSLSRSGSRVKLQDLPYRLLLMLVERAGQLVSREEVRQRLWAQNTFVEFDNSLGVAIRKVRDALNDNAEAPRYVETIPRRGYRFLAPVSVMAGKSPVPGKPSGTEIVANPIPRAEGGLAGSRWQTRHIAMAALALVLALSGIYGVRSLQRTKREKSAPSIEPASVRARRSVAVIGFRNLPGRPEDNWLSSAFAEMLNTELAADGTLRMVSGEDVARAKRELPLSDEDSLAKTTLVRLRTDSGADVVVLGSYTPLPGKREKRIRLDIRLQDTNRGETVTEQAFVGSEDDLFELVGRAGAALRRSL